MVVIQLRLQPFPTKTIKDILMARSETTKPTETEFIINGVTHLVIDVGGQKTYRPTWAVFFDDSKAVIFVVSLASYDQIMAEDSGMNRMHDSMRLFETICNNPLLRSVAMILLLNKVDLFEAKIPRSSVRKHFADLNSKKKKMMMKENIVMNSIPSIVTRYH